MKKDFWSEYNNEDFLMYVAENNAIRNIVIFESIHKEEYIMVDWDISDQEVNLIANAFSIMGWPKMAVQGEKREGNFREVYNSFYYVT